MWKTSDEIKSQLTPTFQKLINDILAKSDGSRPLIFADEQEYQKIFSTPFSLEDNAWFVSDSKQFLIFLRQLSVVTNKEELDIAHELGHMWLILCNYPEKSIKKNFIQNESNTIFVILHNIMDHAIFYPFLKNQYKIDLYKIGNNRLSDFIKDQLPGMKNILQAMIVRFYYILNII